MKLSICSIGDRTGVLTDMIPRIGALGYDGIELWEGHIRDALMSSIYSDVNPDYEVYRLGREWEELLKEAGLIAPVVAGYFRFYAEGTGDVGTGSIHPILRVDCVEKCRKMGILAKILGGDKVRVMMDSVSSADARDADWAQLGYAVKEMAQAVQYLGVTLVLETHQGQLMDTTESTLRLLERIGERNVKVNLDIRNLFDMGENPVEALERLWPYVVHVHLKNLDGEKKPCFLGDGTMDYEGFLKRLMELGYEGYMSVEWFGGDFWGMAEHEMNWLKKQLQR